VAKIKPLPLNSLSSGDIVLIRFKCEGFNRNKTYKFMIVGDDPGSFESYEGYEGYEVYDIEDNEKLQFHKGWFYGWKHYKDHPDYEGENIKQKYYLEVFHIEKLTKD
jgi:hypothetical protein